MDIVDNKNTNKKCLDYIVISSVSMTERAGGLRGQK